MSTELREAPQHFHNTPATIRRSAFLQGWLSLPALFMPRPQRQKPDAVEHKAKANGVPSHGGNRSTPRKTKLYAEVSLARMTRKTRNRMLDQKCRAAGVRSAAGLALAK